MKEDHELFNKYLGRENKRLNDKREAEQREAEAQKMVASTDVSDIIKKLSESTCNAYSLLVGEFEPSGELQTHTIQRGPKAGTTNYKQMWKHRYSDYHWMWHRKVEKTDFVVDRIYKAARQIIAEQRDGYERLKVIMEAGKKPIHDNDANAVYHREEDMLNRVEGVVGAILGKTVLSIFDNLGWRNYLKRLDPKHSPPYRLERVRLAEVIMDGVALEFSKIVKVGYVWQLYLLVVMYASHSLLLFYPLSSAAKQERRDLLTEGFMSTNIDFWTDGYHMRRLERLWWISSRPVTIWRTASHSL